MTFEVGQEVVAQSSEFGEVKATVIRKIANGYYTVKYTEFVNDNFDAPIRTKHENDLSLPTGSIDKNESVVFDVLINGSVRKTYQSSLEAEAFVDGVVDSDSCFSWQIVKVTTTREDYHY